MEGVDKPVSLCLAQDLEEDRLEHMLFEDRVLLFEVGDVNHRSTAASDSLLSSKSTYFRCGSRSLVIVDCEEYFLAMFEWILTSKGC
jgi:hypothetical protein